MLEQEEEISTLECLIIVDKKNKTNKKCTRFQENYQIIGLSIFSMIFL